MKRLIILLLLIPLHSFSQSCKSEDIGKKLKGKWRVNKGISVFQYYEVDSLKSVNINFKKGRCENYTYKDSSYFHFVGKCTIKMTFQNGEKIKYKCEYNLEKDDPNSEEISTYIIFYNMGEYHIEVMELLLVGSNKNQLTFNEGYNLGERTEVLMLKNSW